MILFFLLLLPFSGFAQTACQKVESQLQDGDIVFLAIDRFLFREVAEASLTWTNHVGIAFRGQRSGKWYVFESTFPLSKATPLCDFLDRSIPGQYAVRRLPDLQPQEIRTLQKEARARLGIPYHQGFDYQSWRQFCSKYVHDVFQALNRQEVGHLETFRSLFDRAEREMAVEKFQTTKRFFDRWFWIIGGIPMDRTTVTPGSILEDSDLQSVLNPADFQ